MSYKLYELQDINRGQIYQDFTDPQEVRRSWWGFQPYYPPDGEPGFVNEDFVKLIENRDNLIIRRPIFSMFKLAEEYKKTVKNLPEYLNKSKEPNKFFKKLVELQESLMEHGFYEGDTVLFEREQLDRLEFIFEKVLKIPQSELKDRKKLNEYSDRIKKYLNKNPKDQKAYNYLFEDGSAKFSTALTIGQDDFPVYNQKTTEPSIENNLDANRHLYTEGDKFEDSIAKGVFDKLKDKYKFTKFEYIGSGGFGDAYDVGNDLILKITKDKSEAVENADLLKKKPKYLAQPYGVYKFNSKSLDDEFYAIVLEELETNKDLFEKNLNDLKNYFQENGTSLYDVIDDFMFDTSFSDYESIKENFYQYLNKNPQIQKFFKGLINIINELRNLNVESVDFLTPSNLGYKKSGDLAFFDLGYGNYLKKTKNEPQQYEIDERKKSYMPNSKEVTVKDKCKIGGLGNTSVACNQGDISNLEFKAIDEVTEPSGGYIAYHGTTQKFDNFTDEFVGREEAIDGEGPGIYFTTNYDDAAQYGRYIYTVRLTPRKLIDESSHHDIPEEELEKLIKMTPYWEDIAMNWAENPDIGLDNAISDMMEYAENEKDLFQQIWIDFFRYYPQKFVRGMVQLGYDGEIIEKKKTGDKHIIVFNPNIIEVRDVDDLREENEGINEIIKEELKMSKELLDYAKQFDSDVDLLKSGGFPIDMLDKAAHGFSEDSVKQLMPNQLEIKWKDDLKNVKQEIEHKGLSDKEYAENVDLSEPIDVVYENGKFFVDDGHHRYYAAKILNKPLNVNLEIKDNPIKKMDDGLGYDDYHKKVWELSRNVNEIINEELMKLGENNKISNIEDLPFKKDIYGRGGKIYSVGGAVRDEFLGKKSKDLDILVTGIPMDELSQIMSKYGKVDAVGKSFGILKFKPPEGEEIDVALPRTETPTGEGGHKGFDVKSDHRLSIKDDISRRDFSINAIAKDLHGNVVDPHSGMQDIQNKIIRVVNPQAFADDPLRMLRGIGFSARFDFDIEPKTLKLIQDNAHKINEIPPERILTEFDKIVNKGENIRKGVEYLIKTGLFKQIFGFDFKDSTFDRSKFEEIKTMAEFIYLLTRLSSSPSDFYKNKLKGDIDTYKEIKGLEIGMGDDQENKVKNRVTAYNVHKISPKALKSELLPRPVKIAAQEFDRGLYPKTIGELDVDGNDLKRFGLEGAEIGNTLKSLLIKVYADKVKNNRQDLINSLNYNPSENLD